MMFQIIYKHELKEIINSISFYVFAIVLIGLACLNASNTSPDMVVIIQHGQSLHNAPLFIARFMAIMSVLALLFTVRMVGRSVAKDFQVDIHNFYFTLPMSKAAYLGGRFFASVTANTIIYIGSLLGIFLGCLLIDEKFCGTHQLSAYLYTLFIILIPNIIIIGSLFFSLATLTRKMVFSYIMGVAFLMIYFIAVLGYADTSYETLKVIADPFGIGFLDVVSKYWTIADINHNLVPLNKLIVLNRVVWISVSIMVLFITWRKFKFVSELESREIIRRKRKEVSEVNIAVACVRIPSSPTDASFFTQLQKCYNLIVLEFKRIVFHPAFILITILAMLQICINFTGHDVIESIKYPFTSTYLEHVKSTDVFIISITLIFSGIVVWRERDHKSNELYDVIALPEWTTHFSKLISIVAMQLSVLILFLLLGIFIQEAIYGYTKLELDLYIKSLIGIQLPGYCYLAVLFIFMQNLSNNKYIGYLVCALLMLIGVIVPKYFDSDISLFQYGALPDYIYSNLNGYGHFAAMLTWYQIYWF